MQSNRIYIEECFNVSRIKKKICAKFWFMDVDFSHFPIVRSGILKIPSGIGNGVVQGPSTTRERKGEIKTNQVKMASLLDCKNNIH